MLGEDRELLERTCGHLSDISVALDALTYELGALVTVARFSVMSESGVDPLEHTVYENHGQEE